jgi:iron complex outermembrane receptor protein
MQSFPFGSFAKRIVLLFSFFLIALASLAQTGSIRGNVKDANGLPLAGASVILEGTRRGTVTDANGNYSLDVAPGTYTVIISYVGVLTQRQTVTVTGRGATEASFTTQNSGDLNRVVVVGSRSAAVRSSTQTPAPVDVITSRDLQATGQVEPTQMLNVIAPSFNSSRQTIADGTDHIDPATLRGLGPDQVLVLVNGKRRYNTALLNVNGTIGRGSVGTDLNAIPSASIERIEVLRDGASSQYGSDAIGGVVNVVLKKAAAGTSVNVHLGQYYKGDGGTRQVGLSHGMKLGKQGYINLSGDIRHRDASNRAGDYTGRVYTNNVAQDEALIAERGFSRKNNMLIGNSQIDNGGFVVNFGLPVTSKLQFFGTGSMNWREGKAAGFYRYPRQTTQVIADLYPDGFLPYIYSTIHDKSMIAGVEGKLGQAWNWDLSQTAGGNSFEFNIRNTNNASQYALGNKAQTEFYAGKLAFNQYTTNLNFSRDLGSRMGLRSFNIATGAELRFDNYRIGQGEESSYKNYDPASGRVGGAQVFPGFQPSNAVNETRRVYGIYADLESDVTEKFLVNVAGRFEDYSDYGSNIAGKLALRYKFMDAFTLRGSVSNGFRAPSMHQRYFSSIATVFISTGSGLQPFQQGTFRNNSQVAQAFGIPSLEAETSTNYSLGFTSRLAKSKVNITVDGYQIDIKNRIVLSSSFRRFSSPEATSVNTILNQYPELADVSSVTFFTNAIDTRTRGIDIVTSFTDRVGKGQITLTLAGNLNETEVVGDPRVSTISDSALKARLFARDEKGRYEGAQPKNKFSLGVTYRVNNLSLYYRSTRYGQVYTLDPTNPALDEQFDPRVVTDVSASYRFKNFLTLTLGANNIADVYPDPLKNVANTNSGIFVYSRNATQFGFSGGYYYVNIGIDLHNIGAALRSKPVSSQP